MLGSVQITTSQTTASASFVVIPGLALKFKVEEEEMLVDLELQATVSHSAVDGRVDLDLEVDATRLGATNGLCAHTSSTANALGPVAMRYTLRLAKGDHLVRAMFKTPSGASASVGATNWPARLIARRISHTQVVGQGVNAKSGGIF